MARATPSFTVTDQPTTVVSRRLYVSEDASQLGRMLVEMEPSARSADVDLDPRKYWFRALAVLESGEEEPWENAPVFEVLVTLQESDDTPPAPSEVAIGYVEPTMQVKTAQDPRLKDDAPPMIQEVIVGPDEYTGRVVQQSVVQAAGPLPPEGQRLQVPAFGVEGGTAATVAVLVRNIGPGGKPGPSVSRTIAVPPREGFHVVAVASIVGSTVSGFPASSATTGYEYDGTDGLRCKSFPTSDLMDANWTTIAAANNHPSYYVDNFFLETNEIDLGVDGQFVLEFAHLFQRKTSTGWFATRGMDLFLQAAGPELDDDVRRTGRGPNWIGREVGGDGKARRPVLPEDVRLYFIVAAAAGFPHARSDYVPYGDGTWVKGRYLRCAVAVVDPFSSYQLKSASVSIRAHLRKTDTVGAGSPAGVVTAPPGSTYKRTDGPPWHYVKVSGLGTAGWQDTAGAAGSGISPVKTRPAALTGNVNDYAPVGLTGLDLIYMTSDTSLPRTDTGLAGGSDGYIVGLINADLAAVFTFTREDLASAAANRFSIPTAVALQPGGILWLVYDGTNSRWRTTNPPSGAVAGVEALRAIGTGPLTACAGNDSRLSDARPPTDGSVTDVKFAFSFWGRLFAAMGA